MPTPSFDAAEALELDSSSSSQDSLDAEADSSPAADGKEPSLLDVIKDAVSPDSSSEEGSGEEGAEDEDQPDDTGEEHPEGDEPPQPLSEEEAVARLEAELKEEGRSLQKVQRFREVLTENKELKAEVGDLRNLRQNLDSIATAAEQAGLSEQQVADIFSVPVLMANNPSAAVAKLREISDQLASLAGEKLTPELQTKVEEGYLSEEDAREIVRSRAEASRERRLREIDEQRRSEEAKKASHESTLEALSKYQKSLIDSDPDYTPVARRLHVDRVAAMVRAAGTPSTLDEALSISREAWDQVKKDLASLAPRKSSIRTVTGMRTNSAPKTAPSNMFDAISEAVGGVASED